MLGEWDAPDLQELYAQHIAPDLEFVLSRAWFPDAGVHRGLRAALDAFGAFREAWEELAPTEPEILDCGDRVVALYSIHGRGKGSGVEVETEVGAVATFRDSKIVRLALCTRAEALEAAGLRE
jgi:ketosteroid isomerase-like protein